MDKKTVTLTRVYRSDKDTKFGVRNSVGIKTNEYGDKWLSSLFDPSKGKNGTEDWKEGDTVNIFISEKDGYLNFTLKAKAPSLEELDARLKRIEKALESPVSQTKPDVPDFDENDF